MRHVEMLKSAMGNNNKSQHKIFV